MTRTQRILLLALAVQLGLLFLVRGSVGGGAGGTEPRLLLPELTAEEVRRIELTTSDDLDLALVRAGEAWAVESSGYPADRGKIDEALDSLQSVEVRTPVVKSGRYRDAFEVGESNYQGRVRIFQDGEDPAVDLLLGSAPSYRSVYVRRAESEEVFEIGTISAFEFRPDESLWFDKTLVKIPPDRIESLRVERGESVASYRRVQPTDAGETGSTWVDADGEEVSPESIQPLLDWAADVRLSQPAGRRDDRSQGFDEPAASVTVGWSTDAGEARSETILVGGIVEEQDDQRYLTREGFAFAGKVWAGSLDAILTP